MNAIGYVTLSEDMLPIWASASADPLDLARPTGVRVSLHAPSTKPIGGQRRATMKTDELREAIGNAVYTAQSPELETPSAYQTDAPAIALTICEALGITRAMVESLRLLMPRKPVTLETQALEALTVLLDLAGS